MAAPVGGEVETSVGGWHGPRGAGNREQTLNPRFVRHNHSAYDFGVNAADRRALIEKYRDGYQAIEAAIEGISEEELDRTAEDGWTPRQVIHHLADSEIIGAGRIRLLLVQRHPVIQGYDQELFANTLMYDRPVEASLQVIRWARETTSAVLERMTDDDWQRAGTHTERGRFTAEDWLRLQGPHAHDHAAQIRRARGRA